MSGPGGTYDEAPKTPVDAETAVISQNTMATMTVSGWERPDTLMPG